jgi:parvulin-like peptidyl-prolyl isomerase
MEDVVKALEVGQISSVFKGPEGFYIVKLEEKKGGEQKKFEDVQNDITIGLTLLKQQQALLNYLEELRKKTDIQINENLLSEETGK